MHRFAVVRLMAAAVCVVGSSSAALGQIGTAAGFSGIARNQVFAQSVGAGYSVSSLNTLDLAADRNPNAEFNGLGTYSSLGGAAPARPNVAATQGRPSLFGGGRTASKPFANASAAPTVSPYLNLFREDFDGNSDFNYNTLVRPQLQQQQINQDLQRQSLALNQRVQQIAARGAFTNPAGAEDQMPTGHTTVFRYQSHYYPTPQIRGKR